MQQSRDCCTISRPQVATCVPMGVQRDTSEAMALTNPLEFRTAGRRGTLGARGARHTSGLDQTQRVELMARHMPGRSCKHRARRGGAHGMVAQHSPARPRLGGLGWEWGRPRKPRSTPGWPLAAGRGSALLLPLLTGQSCPAALRTFFITGGSMPLHLARSEAAAQLCWQQHQRRRWCVMQEAGCPLVSSLRKDIWSGLCDAASHGDPCSAGCDRACRSGSSAPVCRRRLQAATQQCRLAAGAHPLRGPGCCPASCGVPITCRGRPAREAAAAS